VITSDFVPIKPFTTETILLAVGQRYDVIFQTNQAVGNYWLRATAVNACASSNNNGAGKAIFSYAGAADGSPSSSAFNDPGDCNEPTVLTPWVKNTVDSTAFINQVGNLNIDISVAQTTTNGQNIVVWSVNLTAIDVTWDKPTLQYVKDKNTSYPSTFNLIEFPVKDTWSYWIIQEPANTRVPIPHPIHLHGHDFYVLGRGSGVFDKSTSPSSLTFENPTRRDTAILPGGGWLAIAFPMDNPGSWLMHCHIAWHVSDGLAVQFLENKDKITSPGADWDSTCQKWNTFQKTMPYPKVDSGLKMMRG
jgi:FtsP/CotA-like multicopper oxidase with cupredoxin domain